MENKNITRAQKFELLQDMVLDTYIEALANNELKAMELAPIVTMLKNNKVVQEKKEHSEADLIDELVEEIE